MTSIRQLFDPTKDIYRSIEKVITYAAAQDARLKTEISEYIVTRRIEEQFRKLLDKMQIAMEAGSENEIGVWVSGFYGSGKSSFTKYLGFALDDNKIVDGVPFIKRLQDRMQTAPVRAQLATVARRFPAAVIMLDLASEMLAGANMADVSTVLYYKVLQWAGYARNLKIAALECKIEGDGLMAEFEGRVAELLPGLTWKDLQNDPLVIDGLIPQIAHEMYPALFPTATSFTASTEGFFLQEDQRVQEMLDIVRTKSGKEHILFIVDEVGQYVASRDNLILNLDGLAKNLKRLGNGKVWIVATAQQTLTVDDPRAALNSEKLYKLKDRFPIQVDLEADDIKEICYRRLLAKSTAGEEELGTWFDTHGQGLRHNTRLQDAKYYDIDLDRKTFIDLYPFLPAHFDILLHLLGALAKSTGGVGLRSAIKVIQDILVGENDGRPPVADQPIGWLATTVTLFDSLERDIRRAYPSIHHAYGTVAVRFPGSAVHQEAAKTIAVLQILGNLPVTVQNVAALMHADIAGASRLDAVRGAVEEMRKDPLVPLGEKEGSLCFLSEKLRDIEQERAGLPLRSIEVRRNFSDALREAFDPLPRVSLHGTLTVTTGLKLQSSASLTALAGDSNAVQTVVEFVAPSDYEAARNRLIPDSSNRSGQKCVYLLGRTDPEADDLAGEIYRAQRIAELHRSDPDQEVKDYCTEQLHHADLLAGRLRDTIRRVLGHGSFVFRGQVTAVAALHDDLLEACKKLLATVAAQVFDRYAEAPARVETAHAEKFLRVTPAAITSALDPLGLVQVVGGRPAIKPDAKAIISVRDYITQNGTVEGKRLLEHFNDDPFGWSPDTVRYILAAMLTVGGEIKLKISGREVTANNTQAQEALKTNRSFGGIGVSLRNERPDNATLARAAERLTDLIGDTVIPLEQEISQAAARSFPRFQRDYAPLAEKLTNLHLAGVERARTLTQTLADVLLTDASEAPQLLGSRDSALYANLKWAAEVTRQLENGMEETLRALQRHRRDIAALPDTGIPGALRADVADEMDRLTQRLQKDDFYRHAADFNSLLTDVRAEVQAAVCSLQAEQKQRLQGSAEDLQRLPEWGELNQQEQSNILADLDALERTVPTDLNGLQQLLARDYDINVRVNAIKESVQRDGRIRKARRIEDQRASYSSQGVTRLSRKVTAPAVIRTAADLDALIRELHEIKTEQALYADFEISITLTE